MTQSNHKTLDGSYRFRDDKQILKKFKQIARENNISSSDLMRYFVRACINNEDFIKMTVLNMGFQKQKFIPPTESEKINRWLINIPSRFDNLVKILGIYVHKDVIQKCVDLDYFLNFVDYDLRINHHIKGDHLIHILNYLEFLPKYHRTTSEPQDSLTTSVHKHYFLGLLNHVV